MNYSEAREYVKKCEHKGIMLGLTRMRRLMGIMGNPQDELSFIHVTGTNGKGSTASFISDILSSAGYVVGKYTSPAVEDIKEQYQINNRWISEEEYSVCVETIKSAIDSMESNGEEIPTVFEIETAIAFEYFKLRKCDYVVLETGLGGIEDATNVVNTTIMAVFASISEDHLGMIGNNIYEIAQNKSGIIKNKCSVVMMENADKGVEDVIAKAVADNSSDILIVRKNDNITYDLLLEGQYQQDNANLAANACRVLAKAGLNITEDNIREGLGNTRWPYRMECISKKPLIYLDGAHNPGAAIRLEEAIQTKFSGEKIILILGIFKDKNYDFIVSKLVPYASKIILLELPNKVRTLDIAGLYECASKYAPDSTDIIRVKSIEEGSEEAINSIKNDEMILACGSLSYLAEIKKSFLDKI